MTDTTQHDPRDEELARLKAQVIQQQARIAQMREALELVKRDAPHNIPYYAFGDNEAACEMSRKLENIEGYGDQVLSTPDDLSALKQHEDKVWNEAVEKCMSEISEDESGRDSGGYFTELIRELKR